MKQVYDDILILSSTLLATIRGYKVENYLKLLDNPEKISFSKHIVKMFASFRRHAKNMAFLLPRFILKKIIMKVPE